MSSKRVIIEESCDDMLSINYGKKCLFYGNVWDFNVNVSTFKELLENLGHVVEVKDMPCLNEEDD